jgi:hypothetical protein
MQLSIIIVFHLKLYVIRYSFPLVAKNATVGIFKILSKSNREYAYSAYCNPFTYLFLYNK